MNDTLNYEKYTLILKHEIEVDGTRVNIDEPIVCNYIISPFEKGKCSNETYILNMLFSKMKEYKESDNNDWSI